MSDREELERLLALHFSANRMPCMSGDPRDRLSPMRRRDLSDAVASILEAGFRRERTETQTGTTSEEHFKNFKPGDWLQLPDYEI